MKSTFLQLIFACIILLSFNEKVNAQCAAASNVVHFVHAGKSYEVIKESKTWATAASCAVTRGGYLVEINSAAEQTAVYTAITTTAGVSNTYTSVSDGGGIAYVWIGATDQMTEGTWLWDGNNDNTGSNFWNGQGSAGAGGGSAVGGAYNNWGGSSAGPPNEPDDFGGNQDDAAIGLAGWPAFNPGFYGNATEWNDIAITNTIYYVVEYNCLKTTNNASHTMCSNDSLVFGSQVLYASDAGSNTEIFTSAAGCDSTVILNLIVDSTQSVSISATICSNDSLPFGTTVLYPNNIGSNTQTFTTASGCDSVVTLTLLVDTSYTITTSAVLCFSDTLQFGTQILNNTNGGWNAETFTTIAGCDSIVNLFLSIINEPSSSYNLSICNGDSILFGSQYFTIVDTGVNTIVLTGSYGCDSTQIVTVNALSPITVSHTEIILLSDSFIFGGQVLYPIDTGIFVDTLIASNGCDSIVNLTLEASRVHIGATTSCLEIFPCPINKYVTIQGALPSYNITIINNAGTTVATVNNTGSIVHIDTSTLSAGTKRVKIEDPLNPAVSIIKIIKP